MYLQNEYALLSLNEECSIVYVENFISSPVIKQMIHLDFFIIHYLFIKYNFFRKKLHDLSLAETPDYKQCS